VPCVAGKSAPIPRIYDDKRQTGKTGTDSTGITASLTGFLALVAFPDGSVAFSFDVIYFIYYDYYYLSKRLFS
jgi:hypothetical protein